MNATQKRLVVTLAIVLAILSLVSINMKKAFSNETNGRIDLFTQKEPYSGKGLNVMSDAFGFGEDVQIYALATYDDEPVSNILVGFEILGPKNSFENFTLYRVAMTDENGTATISFRTPFLPESTLGVWTVFGNAKILNSTANDSVKFKVGWIVDIVSIDTINQNHLSQETFTRASYIGVKIGLRSISMTPKAAYLRVAAYDVLNNSINSTYLDNFVVPPNETIVYAYLFLYVPGNAHLGAATVYASVYPAPISSNSLPYCPEVSKQFSIVTITYTLIIVTSAGGSTDPLPGTYSYPNGSSVQVTANPHQNYIFNHWELNNVSVGSTKSYTVLMDRNQTLKAVFSLAPTGFFIPEWFFWPFLPLLILVILLLIILLFYSKRRRKNTEAAFFSGWTAWYYGYDLRNRNI